MPLGIIIIYFIFSKIRCVCPDTQTVAPPSNHPGALTLSSVLAVRTAATAQPAVTTYHDRLGRPIRTIKEGFNGQLIHIDTVYNNLGQTVATSLPYPAGDIPLWTKTTYDPFGRVATITAPNGAITTNTYAGRTTAVTIDAPDRDAQTNVTLVDAKGRTVKVWNADNAPATTSLEPLTGSTQTASIEYKLDGFGRMRETLLRGQTQTITATYDALGRQTSLDDPDKGDWTYINNALGQVVSQTDAKGNVTTSAFDRLARPLTRVTAEAGSGPVETAHWYYFDTTADTARHLIAQGNKGWIGALQREESITTGAPGHAAAMPATTTAYYYDGKGRPDITLRLIDSKWYYTKTVYDQYNRVSQINHYWRPATDEYGEQAPLAWEDFGYTYTYDTRSYLLALNDTTDQVRAWWEADATAGYDHLDRPVLVRKGNAHWTQRIYRPEDGVLTNIKTGPSAGATSIQNLTYNFDGLGNLTSRANGSLTETFAYDNLNRLTTRNGATIAAYAINGNITSKTDVSGNASGNYAYDSAKPHAVASAWGYTMTYDANGNLLTRTGNGETWTTRWTGFDKPRWLAKTNGSSTTGSEFLHNANRSRVMHLEFDAMANDAPSHYTRKKIYAAGPDVEIDYKNTATGAVTTWQRDKVRIYINAPDGPIGTAEFTSPSTINLNSPDKALVYHTDHLGSIESITNYGDTTATLATDAAGNPSRYSYDPWGERRNPLTWMGKPVTTDSGGANGTASRGYTSHEMLDRLGLVHMNGRIYDQLLARFLSADLQVDDVASLQGYNRYSYVHNNPLTYTDTTGFGKAKAVGWIVKRLENAIAPRIVRQELTHKALANAMSAGGKDLMVKSAQDAWKVANILEGRGAKAFFKHEGHAIKDVAGEVMGVGMKHIQSDSFKGQHIFYTSIAALVVANMASEAKAETEQKIDYSAIDPKLFEGVSAEMSEIYTNVRPGESKLGHAMTVTNWVDEDSAFRHLDWINPLELVAMGGDFGRYIDREWCKELVGFAVTTFEGEGDNKTAKNTFTFNKEGSLESVSRWNDGVIAETISAEEYFNSAEENHKRQEEQKKK